MEVRAATESERPSVVERLCGSNDAASGLLGHFASGASRFDLRDLLIAVGGEQLHGVLFAQTLPARLADFSLASELSSDVADALLSAGVAHAARRGVRLIQTYHDPLFPDAHKIEAFQRAGFHLATRIMKRVRNGLTKSTYPPENSRIQVPTGFQLLDTFDQTIFRDTLVASLEDSLDAPEANVGATPEEILSGYARHCDRMLAMIGTTPVGVVVLDADGVTGDIDYLGVVPQFRRRGLGAAILDHSVRYFASGWASAVRVSVDERNVPAVKLYDRFEFETYQKLNLWLKRVG